MKRRRAAALELRREGRTQAYIAKRLNVSQPTVVHWLEGAKRTRKAHPSEPPGAIGPKLRDGRAPYLTDEDLRKLLEHRADHRVTGSEFQKAIFDAFGVRYSANHCCALLKYLRGGYATRLEAARASDAKPLVRRAGA